MDRNYEFVLVTDLAAWDVLEVDGMGVIITNVITTGTTVTIRTGSRDFTFNTGDRVWADRQGI